MILIKWLINSFIIFISPYLLSGVNIKDFSSAILTALIIGLLNSILKPILIFFTLPLTILTLGLFTFVINALIIILASHFIPGFEVVNFWWALLLSLILSLINSILK